ncbi:hypothetical protein NQ314_004327 [Rhamnusium bicolor]|uniref:Uncharacterized protein n=1 Tax=Rhamnusium bicolor TaxID=1586634 RepID=A0AAV8ZMM1_9CUCU|nr:hypothetical protein NQ314_004327 [Rhamnusium bicolor]
MSKYSKKKIPEGMWQTAEGQTNAAAISNAPSDNNLPFVPFLSDIPKLPKLEAQPEGGFYDSNSSLHRRPPPSKGLTIAKKFNGNISLIPHELSTIAEADSQVSARIGSSPVSPNTSKTSQGISPHKEFEIPEDEENQTISSGKSSKSSDKSTDICMMCNKKCDECSCKKLSETDKSKGKDTSKSKISSPLSLTADVSNKSKTSGDMSLSKSTATISRKSLLVSSSSSDDLESIEAMLKSIGMEWAIPTLHKTHEALALTSSSSSQDLSAKKRLKGNESTGSEISLKDFLSKQMVNKVSSSTLKSDASPASLSMEFSEMSAIQLHSGEDKLKQRTSTPITSSKSSKSKGSLKRVVFSEESDLSSVRDESRKHSDKYSFGSLSEYSNSKNGG